MSKNTKGKCRFCNKEFSRVSIIRHLSSCKARKNELESNHGKKTGYYELFITDKYLKDYWLVIEIDETLKLKDLDQFIRDIWVECCGHLSSFTINGQSYDVSPSEDYFWGPPPKNMNIQLKKILNVGQKFEYMYDFGSATELVLSVKGYREGYSQKDKLIILARNNPPEIICNFCNNNFANYFDPEAEYFDRKPFICTECIENNQEKIDYDEIYLYPVCNSPRMGVCGYEGSTEYPD